MSGVHVTTGQGGLPGQALRESHPVEVLASWLRDSRQRTLALVEDLDDTRLMGLRLAIGDPLLWELGHLAWFAEKWVLRRQGQESLRDDADALYDPAVVPHDARWDLPLPGRQQTLGYLRAVNDRILGRLGENAPGLLDTYFVLLSIFHEDLHGEAMAGTRQVLGYTAPRLETTGSDRGLTPVRGAHPGDVFIPGGRFLLGALPGEAFVFDNEKWAHPVDIRPFAIARAPVTQGEFTAFVDAGGYARRDFWTEEGWRWRETHDAWHPVYWRHEGAGWLRRDFDVWVPVEPDRPMHHVCLYEAEAFCRWARRRLPTEAEWEVAASAWPIPDRPGLSTHKRRYPWGDDCPDAARANLDGRRGGCIDVVGCGDGDSAWGCRQMLGNVWEWTSSDFQPYPGFAIDPYHEYSRPWFGTHKVLRGGSWLTRGRLLRNTWRNFHLPGRRDIWAGFRTCAVE